MTVKLEKRGLGGPRRNLMELQSLTVLLETRKLMHVTKCVRLLGVDFNSDLTSKQLVQNVAKKFFYRLKNMFKIRLCIKETSPLAMKHTMITSKCEYCYAMLYGLPESTLKHFARVQNLSARFVSQQGKYEHITPVLNQFHWLPLRQRVHCKVLILTFKSINGLAPT